jgi:hypothetical protein
LDHQSLERGVDMLSQRDMATYVGMTRLHDANFPGQGIMRVHASHKGSSLVHQPQFNKAGPCHAGHSSPSPNANRTEQAHFETDQLATEW